MMLLLLLMVVTPTLRISAVRLPGLCTEMNLSFLSGAWGRVLEHTQQGSWQNTLLETECDVRNATTDVDA